MSVKETALLIIYAVGALNGLFLFLYWFLQKRGDRGLNRLLSLLILTFTLRLAKAIGVFFLPGLHHLYHVIWFASLAWTAVLLYIYAGRLRRHKTIISLHIVIPTLFTLFLVLFNWNPYTIIIIRLLLAFMLVYFISAIIKLFMGMRKDTQPLNRQWYLATALFTFAELVLFSRALVSWYDVSTYEILFFILSVYILVFAELKWKAVQRIHSTPVAVDDSLADALERAMIREKRYLDSSLTLPVLAGQLGTTPHKLSRYINTRFQQNFNDYVNYHRIREVQQRMDSSEGRKQTIASIALECGFNSLSVFNPSFKRWTGMTPKEYQSRLS